MDLQSISNDPVMALAILDEFHQEEVHHGEWRVVRKTFY